MTEIAEIARVFIIYLTRKAYVERRFAAILSDETVPARWWRRLASAWNFAEEYPILLIKDSNDRGSVKKTKFTYWQDDATG